MKLLYPLIILFAFSFTETYENPSISDKTWSIGVGLVTNKQLNLLQFTKDFKLTKNISLFAALGYINVIGLGITAQSNYNENGLIFGLSGGKDGSEKIFGSLSLAYQWRLGASSTFFSLGLSNNRLELKPCVDGYIFHQNCGDGYTSKWLPVLSFDTRF